jgi:hypothetical protein
MSNKHILYSYLAAFLIIALCNDMRVQAHKHSINLNQIDPKIGKTLSASILVHHTKYFDFTQESLKWKYISAIKYELAQLTNHYNDSSQILFKFKFQRFQEFFYHPISTLNHYTGYFTELLQYLKEYPSDTIPKKIIKDIHIVLQNTADEFKEEIPSHFKNMKTFLRYEHNPILEDFIVY